MKSVKDIMSEYMVRKRAMEPRHAVMVRMTQLYNGEVPIPLPEFSESEKPAVANLIRQGVNQYAGRMVSAKPQIVTPPLKPGIKVSEERARRRRKALMAWQSRGNLNLLEMKRAREFVGFGYSVMEVRWDTVGNCPRWRWRNPMHSYPPARLGIALMRPPSMLYAYQESVAWMMQAFPEEFMALGHNKPPTHQLEVIEYVDEHERVFLCRDAAQTDGNFQQWADGSRDFMPGYESYTSDRPVYEVKRIPNLLGECPVTVVENVGLGMPQGQFEQLEGIYLAQARTFALEMRAIEMGIFPDTYVVSNPNEIGTIVRPASGLDGEVGTVAGGGIQQLQSQPGYMTSHLLDSLERNMRLGGGISPEFGGESPSNVRTARRGSAVLGESVNFTVAEAQEILSAALRAECVLALKMSRKYGGNQMYRMQDGEGLAVEYTPNKDFDLDVVKVSYALLGADSAEAVVAAGQRLGLGTLSKRTMMVADPMVHDVEAELDMIQVERLNEAALSSLQQQAAAGELPLIDLARIMELVRTDRKDLVDAVMQANKEAQERQAAEAPPEAPEVQPGLAMPGMGVEQPVEPPPEGPPPGPMPPVRDMLAQLGGGG